MSQIMLSLDSVFGVVKPVIGMLHLRGETDRDKFDIARIEADQLIEGGVDAVLVEDYFGSPEVVEQVLAYLASERPDMTYGVNILTDFERTFEVARRHGASFVQLDAVAGHLPPEGDVEFAARLAQLRADAAVLTLGGVRFKYQPHLSGRSLEEDLALGAQRCDAIVVTGPATGVETDADKIKEFRELLGPNFPLFVGAGVAVDNAAQQLAITDGAIVGSYFKRNHRDDEPVEPAHVARLMSRVREIRAAYAEQTQ